MEFDQRSNSYTEAGSEPIFEAEKWGDRGRPHSQYDAVCLPIPDRGGRLRQAAAFGLE